MSEPLSSEPNNVLARLRGWTEARLPLAELRGFKDAVAEIERLEREHLQDVDRMDRAAERLEQANKLCSLADAEIERLYEALRKIAIGDGYYGAQAREYKEIAQRALDGCPNGWPAEHGQFGVGA